MLSMSKHERLPHAHPLAEHSKIPLPFDKLRANGILECSTAVFRIMDMAVIEAASTDKAGTPILIGVLQPGDILGRVVNQVIAAINQFSNVGGGVRAKRPAAGCFL